MASDREAPGTVGGVTDDAPTDDVVTETDHRELFQSVAPATADGLYLVPKVIE